MINYTWQATSKEVYWTIYNEHKSHMSVAESFTDMDGYYGDLRALTAWALHKSDTPLIKIKSYTGYSEYYIAVITSGEDYE